MTDLVGKVTKVLLLLMMAITVIVAILFYIDISSVAEGEMPSSDTVVLFLNLGYIFGITSAITAVGFALFKFVMKFIESPMGGVKMVIPFIVLAIIGFVSYANASDIALGMENYLGDDNFTGSSSLKWSGTGLIATYSLAILAVVAIVFAEVSKLIK